MKKLLLVLVVVTMASFLFVGCLPGTTPDPTPDPDPDPDPTPAAPVIEILTNKYVDPLTGVTYVGATADVQVTFGEAVDPDYVVQIAKKDLTGTTYVYTFAADAVPNTARTVWLVEDYDFGATVDTDCTVICLAALVKHPCCPGEEVAFEVVTIDEVGPYATLVLEFDDCAVSCETTESVKLAFTSTDDSDVCDIDDCCGDDCSGPGVWSLSVVEPGCDVNCTTITGSGCGISGLLDCGCLLFAATDTVEYVVTFSFKDKVNNESKSVWTIVLDTDEVTAFSATTDTGTITALEEYWVEVGAPADGDSCDFYVVED